MFRKRKAISILLVAFLLIIALSIFYVFSAVNIVPSGRIDEITEPIDPNDLKPSECNGIPLTTIVNLALGDSPTSGNDLILGTGKADTIDGLGGDDCIWGGDKNDNLTGGDGDDVILGGAKKDSAVGGNGYDICYGGGGSDKVVDFDCEEVYIP